MTQEPNDSGPECTCEKDEDERLESLIIFGNEFYCPSCGTSYKETVTSGGD